MVHSHLIKYKHYARHFYKIYWLFSFPSSWEVEVLCLRRENAGRIEVGCIRKLSGRAPTQNQVEAILKPCSITPHHIQILLPAPKEITFLCVSSCSCSIPTHSQNNPKTRFRFLSHKSCQLYSYILGNWWMDFKNLITYNDMLKTSLLIAFWSWSWYINMIPNQLSKLALMEFNILKA